MCVCVCHIIYVCVTSWRPPHRSLCHSTNRVCVGGSVSVSVSVSCLCRALAHVCGCVCVPCRFQNTYPCPFMCHDSCTYHSLLIHPCDMTRSYVWQDLSIYVPRHSTMRVRHDSFMRMTRLIHMCDMNHSPLSCGGNLHIHSEYVHIRVCTLEYVH